MKNRQIYFLNRSANIIFLKKNDTYLFYLYNSTKFLKYYYSIVFHSNFFINNNLNYFIKIFEINQKKERTKLFLNNILEYMQNLNNTKWIFHGKGFKLKKSKSIINFNFNNSHLKLLQEKKIKILKIQKNVFLILIKLVNLPKYLLNFIFKLFILNIFTKRGVRQNISKILQKKIKKK